MSATPAEVDAPVRADQGPVLPQREGLPALPEDLRPDRGGPPLPRPARRALEQDPPAGHRGEPERLRRRDRGLLQRQRAAVLAARAARPRGGPEQEAGRRARGQAARRGRREAGRRSPRSSPTTRPPRSRAASCSASRRASRTRSSTRPCSPPSRDRSPARSRPTPATTSSGSPRSRKATKQSLEQSKQGIQQLLVSQKQQKELDQFSTNFRNDWRAAHRLRRRTSRSPTAATAASRRRRPRRRCRRARRRRYPASTGANPPALDGTGHQPRRRQRRAAP